MSRILSLSVTRYALPALLFCLLVCGAAQAQTTTFTYQGRLTDAGALANGAYDLQFSLFDTAGAQQGATLEQLGVVVTDGSFVVQLDFGDVFDGTDRVLEIGVRPGGSVDPYTLLAPRWPITSTPYAIRSLKTATADTATTATDATQLGGVAADQYVKTDDPRLGGGGGNFINNGVTPQAGANFNIAGNGIVGGNVGIGVLNPANKLEVNGGVSITTGGSGGGIGFGTPNGETGMTIAGFNRADVRFDGTTLKLLTGVGRTSPSIAGGMAISAANGNVGIGILNPTNKLEVNGGVSMFTGGSGGGIGFGTPNAETGMTISGTNRADVRFDGTTLKLLAGLGRTSPSIAGGMAISAANGNVGIGTITPQTKLHVIGTTRTSVLEISGGADFSENFDVNAVKKTGNEMLKGRVLPGMVVSIDPINPGKLSLTMRAYDRRVAGIISGAGNVRPGMVMGQEGTLADGNHPVALSGRVYCWVDTARGGAIKPGDLLTTSATPGHAMRVINHARAQGAIIGKAMTGLKSGRGLVLVLVTLQ